MTFVRMKKRRRQFRYAKRNYHVNVSDDKVLRKGDVPKVIGRIINRVLRIPPRSILTLNRALAEEGYEYYTNHALSTLVKELRKRGFKVERCSKRRYVVFRSEL